MRLFCGRDAVGAFCGFGGESSSAECSFHHGLYVGAEFFVLLVAAEDSAVRSDNKYGRNTGYSVEVGGHSLCVDNLGPWKLMLRDCAAGVVGLVPYGHSENLQPLRAVFFKQIFYDSRLADAGTAPACPEVDEHRLSFADVVAEALADRVVCYGEVHEFFCPAMWLPC